MAGRAKGRDRKERLQAILREPETLGNVCAFLVEGGTLRSWCQRLDVRYSEVHAWLHDVDHPQRLEAYTLALEGRQSYLGDVVLEGLRDIASADVRKLYDGKGRLLDVHKLPDDMARVVSEVSEDEDARTGNVKRKVKMESRKGGHELLGRALGLYRDRIEHEGRVTLEELVGGGGEGDGSHKGGTRSMAPGSSASPSPPGPRSASKTKGP